MNELTALFSNIFSHQPAELGESYVESSLNDVRYSVAGDQTFQREYTKLPANVPSWLRSDAILGPYEKRTLSTLLSDHDNLIAFRSGTGSGKSTLTSAIRKRARQICALKRDGISWSHQTGLRTFLLVVDLQDCANFSYDRTPDVTVDEETTESFHRWIASSIVGDFFSYAVFDTDGRANLQFFLSYEYVPDHSIREFRRVFQGKMYEIQKNDIVTIDEVRDIFFGILDEFDGRSSLRIALHLLHSAANNLAEQTKRKENFIVCFDNTDRLVSPLLNEFLNTLKSNLANTSYMKSGLKCSTFMRLSTSRDAIGALPHKYYRELSAPDPIDIVIPKMLAFMYNYEAFHEIYSSRTITEARARIVEFLIRLNDPFDRFDEILESIAGTNIRNYFAQLTKLLSSRFFIPRVTPAKDFEKAFSSIGDFLVDLIILRIVLKLNGAMESGINDIASYTINARDVDQVAKLVAAEMHASLESLIVSDTQAGVAVRSRYLHTSELYSACQERIQTRRNANGVFVNSVFRNMAIASFQSIDDTLHRITYDNIKKSQAIALFLKRLIRYSQRLNGALSTVQAEFMPIETIEWYAEFVNEYAIRDGEVNRIPSLRLNGFYVSRYNFSKLVVALGSIKSRFLPESRMTRFEVTQIILGRTSKSESEDYLPVNIFSVDNSRYSPAAMLILFYLGCCEQLERQGQIIKNLRLVDLKNVCESAGLSTKDFQHAMTQMSKIDNRMIYSTVADFSRIEKSGVGAIPADSVVYLSWSGLRYYELLSQNTHYVQWCLLQLNNMTDGKRLPGTDIGIGEGVLDQVPEMGAPEESKNYRGSAVATLERFVQTLLFLSSHRQQHPLEYNVAVGVDDEFSQIVFVHRYPEVNICLQNFPTIYGVSKYLERTSKSKKVAEKARSICDTVKSEAAAICKWAYEAHGDFIVEWELTLQEYEERR